MDENLKTQIEKVVASIFASKEEATKREKTEAALQESADKLAEMQAELAAATQESQDKASVVATLEEQIKTLTEEKASLESKLQEELDKLSVEKAAVVAEFEKLSVEYTTLKTELLADKRMAELTVAGVVREDVAVQRERVKGMSDEEFTNYQEELVAIKAKVIASLTATKTVPSEENTSLEEVIIPANVDANQSAQAALNLEVNHSQDLISKYKDLGEALAKSMTNK